MLAELSVVRCFGGTLKRFSHVSEALGGLEAKFHVFIPPTAPNTAADAQRFPVLIYLSGLTCTDENFVQKAGAFRAAAQLGLVLVAPDTSPRGAGIEGESVSWDFGVGAGFYVNATVAPWNRFYRMDDYVVRELPRVLAGASLPLDMSRVSIMGHSMGGHGALVLSLRNPGMFKSCSAFAPICNPTQCAWGERAFSGYLGSVEAGREYDATELVKTYEGPVLHIRIDQGSADAFYAQKLLLPEHLLAAAEKNSHVDIKYEQQKGYDHGYYFIQTFIDEHLEFHAKILGAAGTTH